MNLKYINRKQTLGISHPRDYIDWAYGVVKNASAYSLSVAQLSNVDYSYWENFTPKGMLDTIKVFDVAVEDMELEFRHNEVEDSFYAKIVRSINTEARKQDKYFMIIDVRPILELGEDLNEANSLDKMVFECGCNPLDQYWIEYSPDKGRQILQVLFEYDVLPYYPEGVSGVENNVLANQFLNCFDDSVRFYGNDCSAPWIKGCERIPHVQSKPFQSSYAMDFGLLMRDDKHIGFLMLASDLP